MSSSSLANKVYLAILLALSLPSCLGGANDTHQHAELSVSNPAMGFFVSRLVPDSIKVNILIPQGADHDTYTPRPSQLKSLNNSLAYLAFGSLEFEITWKARLTDATPSMQWLDMSQGINLIASDHNSADPHYWLSPRQAKKMASNIANAVTDLLPPLSHYTDSALVALNADIDAADSLILDAADAKPGQTFVIYHPALAYLARDYNLHQLSVASEGISPQPRRYAELADSARQADARIFFIQPGTTPDRFAATANEIGCRIVSISPEGPDWRNTMETIAAALKDNE